MKKIKHLIKKTHSVLEIGSGNGLYTYPLLKTGAKITASDISKDSIKKHQGFIEKQNLTIDLLSDENQKTCEEYGVWVEKSMYGRKYFGIERTTFLINKESIITKIWNKVKVPNHIEEVIEFIEKN